MLILFAFCFFICLPFFYFPTLFYKERTCEFPDHLMKMLTLLDAIIYSCTPFLVTLIFSSLTLCTLIKRRKNLKNEFQSSSIKRASFNRNRDSISSRNSYTKVQIQSIKTDRMSKLKLTLMIMTFPLSYLVTTLPVFVILSLKILTTYLKVEIATKFDSEFVIAKTLMYANNSFNILFFILLGKTLRKEMIQLFACKRVSSSKRTNKAKETANELKFKSRIDFV